MGFSKMSGSISVEAEVLQLLSRVPSPPNEEVPKGTTEGEIAECERRIGLTIPRKLRAWLRSSNGPCVGEGGVFGITPKREDLDIERKLALFPNWHERGWIPVAGDGCGNYYVVPTRGEFGDGEPVLFIDTMDDDSAPAYIVASDVWRFLNFMFQRELGQSKWPFNQDEVTTADPDILFFRGVTLPWCA